MYEIFSNTIKYIFAISAACMAAQTVDKALLLQGFAIVGAAFLI